MAGLVEIDENGKVIERARIARPDFKFSDDVMKDPRKIFDATSPFVAHKMMETFVEILDSGTIPEKMQAIYAFSPWRKHIMKEQPQEIINVKINTGKIEGSAVDDINARLEHYREMVSSNPVIEQQPTAPARLVGGDVRRKST